MHKRSRSVYYLLAVTLIGLLGRIFYITRAQPARVASSQSSWTVMVATTRGSIYDVQHRPLVNDSKEYKAALFPDEALLPLIYPATEPTVFEKARNQLSEGVPTSVRLSGPISITEGLKLFYTPVRYGGRVLAPHLIGYMDSSGQKGITGVELACNEILSKYNGQASVTFYTDGGGHCLNGVTPTVLDTTKTSRGGIVLTIDRDIQRLVEDIAPNFITKGAVVVLDPYTGAIKAMASFPSFQPNTVAQSLENNDGALINRAISLYDCGSVFKIITTAAALEAGVSSTQTYNCGGAEDVQGVHFHCHNRLGHQRLTMKSAFSQSCNIYYIRLAQQMGAGALYDMAQSFGFGGSIELADGLTATAPLFPKLSDVENSPGALANLSFGQGYLMTSPLHIAQITATIANNGTMPSVHLIDGYMDEKGHFDQAARNSGKTILSFETAGTLRRMMEAVVSEGTGRSASPSVCTAAGKTGTAETGQIGGEEAVVQSWFTGYFPAEVPKYVVTVLAEDANNTNGQANALFCEISNKLFERM